MYGHVEMRPEVVAYLEQLSPMEDELLSRLRAETSHQPLASMQISKGQGDILKFVVGLVDAKAILEVGVFTGYSSLVMARAMGPDGHLVAVDKSEEWTSIARRYWQEANIDQRIDLRLGEGVAVLDELLADPGQSSFDLVFIDADKLNYINYFEASLRLVRPGGLIVVDNTLWSGDVARSEVVDEDTEAIRQFNTYVAADDRVESVLLPLVDGLTLARRLS